MLSLDWRLVYCYVNGPNSCVLAYRGSSDVHFFIAGWVVSWHQTEILTHSVSLYIVQISLCLAIECLPTLHSHETANHM